jgi:L-lactate dehydrogenase
VDVITYVALKLSGLPARRVFGSGTVLDSSRFRHLIARRCRVAVQNVHAYIVGAEREQIVGAVKNAAYQIIQGKGATNYAIGLATARILESVLYDEDRILPVSSLLSQYQGIDDVCLSVPAIVDRSGVDAPLPVPLDQTERAGLLSSAQTVRSAVRSLGF